MLLFNNLYSYIYINKRKCLCVCRCVCVSVCPRCPGKSTAPRDLKFFFWKDLDMGMCAWDPDFLIFYSFFLNFMFYAIFVVFSPLMTDKSINIRSNKKIIAPVERRENFVSENVIFI